MLSAPLQAIAQSGSLADSTKAGYSRAWRQFAEWAEAEGRELPSASAVAAYLQHLAEQGRRMATLKSFLAAAKKVHLLMGWPGLKVLEVVETQKRLAREIGGPQKQAWGLTQEGIAAILETAREPIRKRGGALETTDEARERGDVDVALVCLMSDTMLRIGEAAALRWRDVFPEKNGTGSVMVARSKTDQEGVGQLRYVGQRAMAALAVLRPPDAAPNGLLFRGQSRYALTRRIDRACERAGLGKGFSGHSPRVGMAQDLVAKGASLAELMVAGGWKSSDMPGRYAARQALRWGAVAKLHGETGLPDVAVAAPGGSRPPDPGLRMPRVARRHAPRRDRKRINHESDIGDHHQRGHRR